MIKKIEFPILLLITDKGLTKKKIAQRLTEEVWKSSQYVDIQNAEHNYKRDNLGILWSSMIDSFG
jgi:hypothetical protein